MAGKVLDGQAAAHRVEARVAAEAERIQRSTGQPLRLDAILVGDDPASEIYVRRKREAAARAKVDSRLHVLPPTSTTRSVADLIATLNRDDAVTGVLLQLPLPDGIAKDGLLEAIDPAKDVDGFHPLNLGRAVAGTGALLPATPKGILQLLDDAHVPLKGQEVVIVNHGNLIGRPLAALLMQRDATVTVCHKFTRDLAAHTRRADVLVTATGVAGLIGAGHVKPGAVVIDAGIARDGKKVVGDVRFDEVLAVASLLTPVPGGVGPMTVASLLDNVLAAHRLQHPGALKTSP